MSTSPATCGGDDRLLDTLQRLLTIQAPELRPALDQASSLVSTVLRAEKVDVFLYDAATASLVAMGTSDTPLGRRQYQLGLNRQPLANGGPSADVFQSGEPYLTGHADQDPDQLRGVVQGLGVRSAMDVPLWSAQQLDTRGITSHLERSRRGGHLWILFEPIQAKLARRLVMGCLPELQVEVFPKRDQLDDQTRVGNLVRGPFGIHRLTGQRYPLVDPISLQPVRKTVVGTLEDLAEVERISVDRVGELLDSLPQRVGSLSGFPKSGSVQAGRGRHHQTPMERLKTRLGDPYDFISRYVELNQDGRGHCPFHPPDYHPSFAVN